MAAAAQTLVHPEIAINTARKRRDLFLPMAGVVMASGAVVLREPAPYDVCLLLMFVTGVLLKRLSFHPCHRTPVLLLIAFIVANFLPLPNTFDPGVAVGYSMIGFYLIVSWLFFAGFSTRYGYRGAAALMKGYIFAGVLSAALATLAYLRIIPFQSTLLRYGRAQALFKDPNVYGPYLIPVLLFMLTILQRANLASMRFWKAVAICLLCAIGIFLSYSRACWIDCTVAILCFTGLQLVSALRTGRIDPGLVRVAAVIAVLAATTGVFISSEPEIRQMLFQRLGNNGLQDYDAVRFETQGKAIDTVLGNPVGIGTRQSEFAFDYATHNMYLRVLVENGFLGFTAFFLLLGVSLFRSIRIALTCANTKWRNLFLVLSSSLAGLMVNGFVIDTIRWRHLWFLFGLAWCIPACNRTATKIDTSL